MRDIRLDLAPQMFDYDKIGLKWHPNIMFFHRENYISRAVKTDDYGFRFTVSNTSKFSPLSYFNSLSKDQISLVVGGSTAFGVGASSDQYNLASLMTNISGTNFLNFGARAFNSDQELSLFKNFIHQLPKIKEVIILSGVNDLYLSHLRNNSFMPEFFFGNTYSKAMNSYTLSNKKKILKLILKAFGLKEEVFEYLNFNQISIPFLKNSFKHKNTKQTKDYKNTVSFEKGFKRTTTSLIFWSYLSKIFNFKITFALQPVPSWCKKQLTLEEKKLFLYYDYKYPQASETLKSIENRTKYLKLTKDFEDFCNKFSINYVDTNMAFKNSHCLHDWLFVDRVHLNDNGYKELALFLLNL